MYSILKQLAKYHPTPTTGIVPTQNPVHIAQAEHPYQKMVEFLCDTRDLLQRKKLVNDALLALNDFTPPPMADQLYPLELAVLYHLFYRHKVILCGEGKADYLFGVFLKDTAASQGIDTYMRVLKNCLDKTSTSIFLYRVMLAALGARGKWDNKRDHLDKEYGIKAARALGVEPTAKAAGHGLDSLAGSDAEQLILGRITYIAFWEWSQAAPVIDCDDYLSVRQLTSGGILALGPIPQKPAALPPHQP